MNQSSDLDRLSAPSLDAGSPSEHERVVQKRSHLTSLLLAAAAVALGWLGLAATSGADEESVTPTTLSTEPVPTVIVTTVAPPTSLEPVVKPVLEGHLADGRPYEVWESAVGLLCARIGNGVAPTILESESLEICHTELETASGARLHDDVLIFGYLAPGADRVAVKYRQSGTTSEGVRTDPLARFFSVPLIAPDLYRLQYVSERDGVIDERSMIPFSGSPSQPPEEARRDGVDESIAALPFNRRVNVQIENTLPDEGPWVVSQYVRLRDDQECLGDTDENGDLFPQPCRQLETEVLLLDNTGLVVVQAFPLPGLTARDMWVYDNAIYVVGRVGVGPALDENQSFVARVGREDRTLVVQEFAGIRVDDLGETPDGLLHLNFDGGVTLDPVTLEQLS